MLQKEPEDVFLNYALALEHIANADLNKAEEQLNKTLTLNSAYLPVYYQMGQLQEKKNNPEAAMEYYRKGIELAKQQGNTKAMGELNEALWMLED